MSAPANTLLAWHYSTADRLQSIQRSGLILPASAGIPATERPVSWFSLHPLSQPPPKDWLTAPLASAALPPLPR